MGAPDPTRLNAANWERALVGAALMLPDDAAMRLLHDVAPGDMADPFARAAWTAMRQAVIGKRGAALALAFDVFALCDRMGPFVEGDALNVTTREHFAACITHHAAMTEQDADLCADMVREMAERRRRYKASMDAAALACDTRRTVGEVDAETNALYRRARGHGK